MDIGNTSQIYNAPNIGGRNQQDNTGKNNVAQFNLSQNTQQLSNILNLIITLIQQLLAQLSKQQEGNTNNSKNGQQANSQIGFSAPTTQQEEQDTTGETPLNIDDNQRVRLQLALSEGNSTPSDIFDTNGDGQISVGDRLQISDRIFDANGNIVDVSRRFETLTQEQFNRFLAQPINNASQGSGSTA